MEKQIIEEAVFTHAERLKRTYNAPEVEVVICDDEMGLSDIYQRIARKDLTTKGKHPASESGFGMMFVPSFNTAENRPFIVVRTDLYTPDSIHIRNDLTHEFSNLEAFRRWGEELRLEKDIAADRHSYMFDEYSVRVFQQAGVFDKLRLAFGRHPASFIEKIRSLWWFPLRDTPVSIPADHVTVDKGFEDRLMTRKSSKLDIWTADAIRSMDPLAAKVHLSTSFPYFAYLTFHPRKKRAEERLESHLLPYLAFADYLPILSYLRRIRNLLHEVDIPVEHQNLHEVSQRVQEIYFGAMAEFGPRGSRQYWGVLRDLAREGYNIEVQASQLGIG